MPKPSATQSEPTEPTSEDSSKNESMTKQSHQELKRLLHEVNKLVVQTAIASVPTKDYVTRPFRRRLYKEQAKHTRKLLLHLSEAEKALLLKELSSRTESKSSNLVLPSHVKNSE